MAARAPKQWSLTRHETITTYEGWRQNLIYHLSLDNHFQAFLQPNFVWGSKTSGSPNCNLQNDADTDNGRTAAQKCAVVDLMVAQVANFCPIISRKTITHKCGSFDQIWSTIRAHYGFQFNGGQILDLASFRQNSDELPEDLFQRLTAFFEDNLLTATNGVTHHGETATTDEDLSPTIENTIVAMWLQLLHPGLPQLVKQRYGTELRQKTLASIKQEISQALNTLLEELRCMEESKVMRTSFRNLDDKKMFRPTKQLSAPTKSCTLCKAAKRPNYGSHYLSSCPFLPESDRHAIQRNNKSSVRQATYYDESNNNNDCDDDNENDNDECIDDQDSAQPTGSNVIRRINSAASPFLDVFFKQYPTRITLDTGAETNMMRHSFAKKAGISISKSTQSARQADGITLMKVIGEAHISLNRGQHRFNLDALVVEDLDVDIIAGTPFMESNDIGVKPARKEIDLCGKEVVSYGCNTVSRKTTSIRRMKHYPLPETDIILLPGEKFKLDIPHEFIKNTEAIAIEPLGNQTPSQKVWPFPQIIESDQYHDIHVVNSSDSAISITKNVAFCSVQNTTEIEVLHRHEETTSFSEIRMTNYNSISDQIFSSHVSVDPDSQLTPQEREDFHKINQKFDNVFNPQISVYNGVSGPISATVNIGPVQPPQRKGRIPLYSRNSLVELQSKFDDLEQLGVFAKPEDLNIQVEYINPSFLVKKNKGGYRLVTNFSEVGSYTKPQPSMLPNINDTLCKVSLWKYVIVTDLSSSYYQIPLCKQSMRYCGVATPYKGTRVYTRSAMGMPGSETALEELMCRILGDLLFEGRVAKIADDLYCGGNSVVEACENWKLLLSALDQNNMKLPANKTVICPTNTTILGWTWSSGTIQANSHKVAPLAVCKVPETVSQLRSYIGSYKALSRVLPHIIGQLTSILLYGVSYQPSMA